jgi:hypothetical protein
MKPSEFKAFWKAIQTSNTELPGFLYADLQKLLLRQGNPQGYDYPMLIVERPSVKINKNGVEVYASAFSVIKNVQPGDDEAFDAADDLTFEIAKDILAKLIKDGRTGSIDLGSVDEHALEPIDSITLDGDVGYRYEFDLSDSGNGTGICFNPLKWNP